ncbi:MAG: flavin reductase [Deltaproteobacteria bacterium]|nr:flavin reductase [Deltaproteobacteria bacterium]
MSYGIYVLTAAHGEVKNGMIASWVSQVSYEPPLIMVAVHPNRYCHQLIKKSGFFALHLLRRDQKDYIRRFKGQDPEAKFESLAWFPGKRGCPILRACIGYLGCEVRESLEPGNHTLFIGEVVEAGIFEAGAPLSTFDYEGFYLGKA